MYAVRVPPVSTMRIAAGTGRLSGSRHRDRDGRTPERAGQDVKEPRASVGQRLQGEVVVGRAASPALGDRLGGLAGAERAGETVGGYEDAHVPMLSGRHAMA